MEIVAVYVRVSTREQAKKGAESSLSTQLKKCMDYCNEKGYEVLKVYSDVESGGNDDRTGFNELLGVIPKKIYTKVVFWEISRIARIASTGMKFFEDLEKHKITFDSISQPYIRDVMTLGIFLSMAANERLLISQRVKTNMIEKVKMGRHVRGKAPLGYIKKEGYLYPHPEQSDYVRSIFETYIETENLSEVARIFGKTRADITEIIDNRTYLGYVVSGRRVGDLHNGYKHAKAGEETWYKGLHEAIVDEDIFNHCQKLRDINRKTSVYRENFEPRLIFSSIITCSCGKKMFQSKKKSKYKDTEYYYYSYVCSDRSHRKYISADKLDKAIKEYICNSEELKKLNDVVADKDDVQLRIEKMEQRIDSLSNERKRLIKLFQKALINENELEEEFKKIEKQKKEIESKIENHKADMKVEQVAENNIENFEQLKFILEHSDHADVIKTRNILSYLIKEIRIKSFKPIEFNISFRV